ncbi:hypothetical protein TELCIR_20558, partial [Teladorsagia circumcincta]
GAPRFGAKSLARGSMKRRHRPGALALKEIRRLQKSTHNLIPRLPLQRVFREVVRELYPNALEKLEDYGEREGWATARDFLTA